MSIIEKAEEHISGYAEGKFVKAFMRVEKEMHGKGCGCPSCKKNAVRDINQWTDFLSKGNYPVKYGLENKCGRTEIVQKTSKEEDE